MSWRLGSFRERLRGLTSTPNWQGLESIINNFAIISVEYGGIMSPELHRSFVS